MEMLYRWLNTQEQAEVSSDKLRLYVMPKERRRLALSVSLAITAKTET